MSYVQIEKDEHVAILMMDRPPVNTLSKQMIRNLHDALSDVEEDAEVKVIVLRGSNNHFVGGAELNEFTEIHSKEEASEFSSIGHHLMNRIESLKKPVIASIEGACLGGGLELALACHMRVAAENAIFGLPEVSLGIIPGAGGTQRLPKVIGEAEATYWILTGNRYTSEEAEKLGLIQKRFPTDELFEGTMRMAKEIAKNSAVAIQHAFQAILAGREAGNRNGYQLEAENFGACFETYDKEEGIQAFLEKREPVFLNK